MGPLARSFVRFVLFAVAGTAVAQVESKDAARTRARLAEAISAWAEDYDRGRLAPKGPLRGDSGLQPRYAQIALAADLLSDKDAGGLLHFDALHKLLYFAERDADEAVGRAVLQVAAAGFDRTLADREAFVVREAGHTSLVRIENQAVWFLLMRTAAGERLPFLGEPREDEEERVGPAMRVAALRALGQKGAPVFRSTIEGALEDLDPRVRLGAVEALDVMRRRESLSVLARMLAVERHPVVSQAAVRAVRQALSVHADSLTDEERERASAAALRLFGQAGWRTDMDLLEFVESFPSKAAVEPLLAVLERPVRADKLVDLVNQNATPRLRARAIECLRGLTGALLPDDEPATWREFWARERDRVVVPRTLPHTRVTGTTKSTFFGIPVEGREIAFLIDSSGSMSAPIAQGPVTGRFERRAPTRLAAAKDQVVQAVQAMPPESRYHLLTFESKVHVWSRKAIPPTGASTRSLVELLSTVKADGGTNLHDGLVASLQLDEVHLGEEGKHAIDELFVLSDGMPTAGPQQGADEILEMVRLANRYLKVRIHCVFTGSGAGSEFLQKLAEQNGGVFVQR